MIINGTSAMTSFHFSLQEILVSRYVAARLAWLIVNKTAPVVTMTEREYCDAYVAQMGGFSWTSTGTSEMPYLNADEAYEASAGSVGGSEP